MNIKKPGRAGSVESGDIMVLIEPTDSDEIEIELQSVVMKQYGNQIRKKIIEVLKENNISAAKVSVMDKGAVDFVIKARTEAAIDRACENSSGRWEE